MADLKPKLRVDVNKNPTKAGIKVQFVLPQTIEGDKKAEITQKLQAKLNQGLGQYNLTISQDTDTPYSNVIGFLIPIADIKLLIKNAIGGGASEPAPEEMPAEEPVAEGMEDPEGEWDKLNSEERAGILKKLIPGVENSPIYNSLKGNAATLDNLSAKNKQKVLSHLAMKKGMKEVDRLKELAGIKEKFDPFLDTEEGGYMREYIDSVAEENGLDLSYRGDFDEAFNKALQQLKSENIYPELDFNAIVAHKESFWK